MDASLVGTVAAIKTWIDGLNAVQVLSSPYFLGGAAIFCFIALARQMIRALVLFLAAVGLILLVHYTVPMATGSMKIAGQSLVFFGAGGLAICALVIYFVLIRSE